MIDPILKILKQVVFDVGMYFSRLRNNSAKKQRKNKFSFNFNVFGPPCMIIWKKKKEYQQIIQIQLQSEDQVFCVTGRPQKQGEGVFSLFFIIKKT